MMNTPDARPALPTPVAHEIDGGDQPGLALAPRDRAVQLLTDRYADETIGEVEFERRLALLSVASSPAEFDALVADLLTASPGRFADPVPVGATGSEVVPDEAGSMFAMMNESRRSGPWTVPRRFTVRAIMSDVKIDLREARVGAGTTIDVKALMAAVKIVVPPGMRVVFDATGFMGSALSKATPGDPYVIDEGTIRVTGFAMMAELKVIVRARSKRLQ